MTALPTFESQPIGNYGESCMQFRMPVGWQADWQAQVKRWEDEQKEKLVNKLNGSES